jgi:glucokinase
MKITRVLAGDIGGTKTLLRISECEQGECRRVHEQRFASRDYPDFPALLHAFLPPDGGRIDAACFGLPGPVREIDGGQEVRVTNLPWVVRSRALVDEFGWLRVRLINDFQAVGYAVENLPSGELTVLQAGEPVRHGTRAVIGAGTGLGQCLLVWQGDHYEAYATEGGRVGFAPADAEQVELVRYLLAQHGRSCFESVLSGPGLLRLYRFLVAGGTEPESPELAATIAQTVDPAAVITRAALDGNDRLARRTLELFIRIYGSHAGNVVLASGATGGLYLAGGIAPRLMSLLQNGRFLQEFLNKPAMEHLLATVPVYVIRCDDAGLRGATAVALRLLD